MQLNIILKSGVAITLSNVSREEANEVMELFNRRKNTWWLWRLLRNDGEFASIRWRAIDAITVGELKNSFKNS